MAWARAHIPDEPSEAHLTASTAQGLNASGLRSWLNTVIPAIGVPRAATAADQAEPTHHAEAAPMPITGQPVLSHAPQAAESNRSAFEPDHDLGLLCDRLDTLTRQLTRLAARMDADRPAAAAAKAAAGDPVEAAIAEIFARQRVLAEAEPAGPTMFPPAASPSAPDPAAYTGQAARISNTPDLSSLEQHLKLITKQLEILRSPCRAEELVAELRQELNGIAKTLEILVPRSAFDALEQEVHALSDRLYSTRETSADASSLAKLEQGLAEIRDAIANLAPVELNEAVQTLSHKVDQINGAGVDPLTLQQLDAATNSLRSIVTQIATGDALAALVNEVRELSEKIDRNAQATAELAPTSLDRDLLLALEKEISGIATTLNAKADQVPAPAIDPLIESIVHKLDRFDLLADDATFLAPIKAQIGELGDKIDRFQLPSADPAALAPLEAQLGQLTNTIERMNAPGTVPAALDERMHAIAMKLDRLEENAPARADIGPLEQRIAELAEKLGASEARLGNLQAIEHGMNELIARLDEIRKAAGVDIHPPVLPVGSPGATGSSARYGVATDPQIVASEPTAFLTETRPRSSLDDFFGGAPPSGGASAPADYEPDDTVAEPWPASSPRVEPVRAAEPVHAAMPAERAEPATPAAPAAIEPPADTLNLPPDAPIEPGSAPPRFRGGRSAAERIAASQAMLGPVPADRTAGTGPRPNFIIAARRAAQAASEQLEQTPASARSGETTPGSVRNALAKRVKSLFVTSSMVLLALGATGVMLSFTPFLNSEGGRRGEIASPPATTAAVPHRSAPQIASAPSTLATSRTASSAPVAKDATASLTMPAVPAAAEGKRHQERLSAVASADTTGSLGLPRATLLQPVPAAEPVAAAPDKIAPWSDSLPPALKTKPLLAGVEARNPGAAYEIGLRYAEGRGVEMDMAAAAIWLARAAEGGIVPAQFRLGGMYEKGLGLKKDLEQARRYYLAAADRGNAHAMHNLAVLYAEGADSKPDFVAAVKWFRKAAEQGVADSQYNAAVLLARGIGGEQNLGEAYKWFAVAANSGDKDAAKKRDEIGERLDAQTLAAARLAASVFVPTPQPEEATTVRAPASGWDDVSVTPPKPRSRARQHGSQAARL